MPLRVNRSRMRCSRSGCWRQSMSVREIRIRPQNRIRLSRFCNLRGPLTEGKRQTALRSSGDLVFDKVAVGWSQDSRVFEVRIADSISESQTFLHSIR
jgi:hypothetical protein